MFVQTQSPSLASLSAVCYRFNSRPEIKHFSRVGVSLRSPDSLISVPTHPSGGNDACFFLRMLNLYHRLSGINDCPSVGFDMASNSCPHEKVIRCPCVRIMTSTLFKQAPASTDDETPGQLGEKEQEFCVFFYYCFIFYILLHLVLKARP